MWKRVWVRIRCWWWALKLRWHFRNSQARKKDLDSLALLVGLGGFAQRLPNETDSELRARIKKGLVM